MMSRRERSVQYTVTLPRAIVEAMGWSKGQPLELHIKGKGILELREAKVTTPPLNPTKEDHNGESIRARRSRSR